MPWYKNSKFWASVLSALAIAFGIGEASTEKGLILPMLGLGVVGSFYREHERVRKVFVGESKTKQSFKDETDVHQILAKFSRTGVLQQSQRVAEFLDVPDDLDFEGAMHYVIGARDAFAELPAEVRRRFENDPGQLLAFLNDGANLDEARELGLVPYPEPPQEPVESAPAAVEQPPAE